MIVHVARLDDDPAERDVEPPAAVDANDRGVREQESRRRPERGPKP
jgi:hypothetical protein